MKKILFLYAGIILSVTTLFGQDLPKLKVTERDLSESIFRVTTGNETVVEVQSNVLLSFESTMDKAVNVYDFHNENGFYFYKLLFSTVYNNKPIKGRKLKIKSYGFDTYTLSLELKAKEPVGLLVINETQSIADNLFHQGKYAEALKEYEKVFSINPKDSYINLRIELCNKEIEKNKTAQKDNNAVVPKTTVPQVAKQQEASKKTTGQMVNFTFIGINRRLSAKLYLDNQLIGETYNAKRFQLSYSDPKPGLHQLRIVWNKSISEWSGVINTATQTNFRFANSRTGYGYKFGPVR
jgi:tetratricopeptide (TPR) repeat protein